MHYPDSKDRSAELLRQAIPMMAQHPAPLHPITYAVWYDYLAGRNPGLKAEMDQVVARQVPMSDTLVHTLYRRHILESAAETAQKVSDGLRAVIDEVGTTATLTGERVSEFTASLQEKSGRMASLGMPANLGIELDAAALPFLPRAREWAEAGHVTGASKRNWASYGAEVALPADLPEWQRHLLTDPQTSGGLLVACAPDAAAGLLAEIRAAGYPAAAQVGRVTSDILGVTVGNG